MRDPWVFWDDYRRYRTELKCVFHEPSIIMVFLYRVRTALYSRLKLRLLRWPVMICIEPFYFLLTLLFGIHLPKSCTIGGGLMIHHFGGIVLNPLTVIGRNCTLRQNVTIGIRKGNDDVPVLGDHVNIGAGAVVMGAIRIGHHVDIGANSVVLTDVPDHCIAVGVPARVTPKKR